MKSLLRVVYLKKTIAQKPLTCIYN